MKKIVSSSWECVPGSRSLGVGFRQPFRILSFKPASWHFRTTRYLKQAVNKNTKNTPCVKVASVCIRSIQWAQTVGTDCLAPCLVLTIDWPLFMLQNGNNQRTRFIGCSFTHSSICSFLQQKCIEYLPLPPPGKRNSDKSLCPRGVYIPGHFTSRIE